MTEQDEFDQLRDRIETIESELGIETEDEDVGLHGVLLFVKLTDAGGSSLYAPLDAVKSVDEHTTTSSNPYDIEVEKRIRGFTDDLEIREAECGWYTSEVEVLTAGEVRHELM